VLRSSSDLTPLADHLGEHVIVLSNDEAEGAFLLALEASIDGLSPEELVEYFLRLIDTMPTEQRAIWDRCSSRIFDFGFQAGCNASPSELKIEPAVLRILAERGVTVEVTIYAYRCDAEA
jgi:hypothetical protein